MIYLFAERGTCSDNGTLIPNPLHFRLCLRLLLIHVLRHTFISLLNNYIPPSSGGSIIGTKFYYPLKKLLALCNQPLHLISFHSHGLLFNIKLATFSKFIIKAI
jgi:hypothetical protein